MADLLKTASDWLAGVLQTHVSQTVTYHSGGDFVEITATVGMTEFEQMNDAGAVERVEMRDYLISAADLVLHGAPHVPQRGDEVRETRGGTTYVYTVTSPAGQPHWRNSDRYGNHLRIHTTLTDTE